MKIFPAGLKVHLALGYTDTRKGLNGLAMPVQQTLKLDPFSGHLFAFRGKKTSMLEILFWDGNGLCLFTNRLDQGASFWLTMAGCDGSITLTPTLFAMLIEDIDWRAPERVWKPALVGGKLNQHRIQRICFFESGDSGSFGHAFDFDDLPSEPTLLQRLVRDMAAAVEHRDGEIERLKPIIKRLQRAQFGRRSERLDPYQLRSRSKRATATLPARKRSVRVAKSKQTNGPLDASRRPAI